MTLRTTLAIINIFLIGFLLGKYVQEECYTPQPVTKMSVNLDSLQQQYTQSIDSLQGVHEQETKRMSEGYQTMLELISKYEMALDEMRETNLPAYMRFVRIAQFKEDYNEMVHRDFLLHSKVQKYSASQAFK